jgi:hypothetical protein
MHSKYSKINLKKQMGRFKLFFKCLENIFDKSIFPVYECIVPSNRPMNEQSRTMNAWYPYHPMYI